MWEFFIITVKPRAIIPGCIVLHNPPFYLVPEQILFYIGPRVCLYPVSLVPLQNPCRKQRIEVSLYCKTCDGHDVLRDYNYHNFRLYPYPELL
jgi:hypothetical protein